MPMLVGRKGDIFSSRLRKFGRTEMCTRRCFYQDVVVCTVPVVVNCVQISVPSTFSHSAFFFFFLFFLANGSKTVRAVGKTGAADKVLITHMPTHAPSRVTVYVYVYIYTHKHHPPSATVQASFYGGEPLLLSSSFFLYFK